VLEDGRLTDNYGNLVDFTNTLIIMTSNLGSRNIAGEDGIGFSSDTQVRASAEVREIVDRELRRHFPPEFLNRVDDVIVFDALSDDSMLQVARLLLDETFDNLARRNITVTLDDAVPGWLLAQCGIDPQAGARPLRRLVRRHIEDAVADFLLTRRSTGPLALEVALRCDRPVVRGRDEVVESVQSAHPGESDQSQETP
jgi:ATP-dependent Clp protease ATP-binding subunit ClpA